MKRLFTTLIGFLLFPLVALSQQVPIKTVPVATGSQFLLFPSQNGGMGGVSIALGDPFTNPARGIVWQGIQFVSAPSYYGIALEETWQNDSSSGRTLPLGVLLRQGKVFGGAMVAWQELSQETEDVFFVDPWMDMGISVRPERRSTSTNNQYVFGLLGAQVPGTQLAMGASVFVAGLNGLEGVRLLYWDGGRVRQGGQMSQFRLGLYHNWGQRHAADLTILHHRFHMDHDMPRWDPALQETVTHTEKDETLSWALQATYQMRLGEGWRFGGRVTGDWKRHPKIPNYDVMQIPRDPGNSSAYNLGVGLSRTVGKATFGVDLIYEPIWSHTWADALEDTPTTGESTPRVISAGEMTVENFFRFDNTITRLGVRRAGDRFELALGLNLHTYRYHLDQEDFVRQITRDQDESWSEWTGTLGLGLHFEEFQIRYTGLLTLGTGRPGIFMPWGDDVLEAANAAADFVIAPGGALSLQDARVTTHQVAVIIPIIQGDR